LAKIETILTDCITEIKSGRAALAECLDRYPAQRGELEPLLRMALQIQAPPAFRMDNRDRQAVRARLLQQIGLSRRTRSRSVGDFFSFGLSPRLVWARVAVAVLAVVILLSALTAGTAYASQSSLPGDWLYPVKIGTENARLLLAVDSAGKARLNLQFAQTRLTEMNKLAADNAENAASAVHRYRGQLSAVREEMQKTSDPLVLSALLNEALTDVQNQMLFCDTALDSSPLYPAPVREASDLTVNAQAEYLRMLARQDILQAARINLDDMQDRLQRARTKAGAHQLPAMQAALVQYQEFNQLGAEILQSAEDEHNQDFAIAELSLQAVSSYLDTLNIIAEEVPLEYRDIITSCRQTTLQFQTQARHRYQYRGGSGPGSESLIPADPGGMPVGENAAGPGDSLSPALENGSAPGGSPDSAAGSEESPGDSPSPAGGNGTGPGGSPDSGAGSGVVPGDSPSPTGGNGPGPGGSPDSGASSGAGPGDSPDSGAGSGPGPGGSPDSGASSGAGPGDSTSPAEGNGPGPGGSMDSGAGSGAGPNATSSPSVDNGGNADTGHKANSGNHR
jgi:hypothetical protein